MYLANLAFTEFVLVEMKHINGSLIIYNYLILICPAVSGSMSHFQTLVPVWMLYYVV
jgi:hypothetical protein